MPRNLKPVMSCLCCWVAAASALAADGSGQDAGPPWPAQYKIKPAETERLTEADVVGPDGIVYPNWTKCGVQGGIPQVAAKATIEAFDGRPTTDRTIRRRWTGPARPWRPKAAGPCCWARAPTISIGR